MVLYGLSLFVLEDQIWTDLPGFIQSWYTDELSIAGAGANLPPGIERIEELGPARGLYLESEKLPFVRAQRVTKDMAWLETAPLKCAHR